MTNGTTSTLSVRPALERECFVGEQQLAFGNVQVDLARPREGFSLFKILISLHTDPSSPYGDGHFQELITELDALDAMEIADLLTKAARQVMELSSIAECEGKR